MSHPDFSESLTGGPSVANSVRSKVMGSVFQVDQRYQLLGVLGTGAFGVVVAAKDLQTGEKVAIKKIEKVFEHQTFAKRTLRELKIMRLLEHENVIGVKSIQLPLSKTDFNEIYVVTELMDADLNSIIRSPQVLTDEHCKFFLYQILRGVKYLHSAQILHRDLKPRNILLKSDCDLKICDFGLARPYIKELKISAVDMTDYVATRWYRSPELLLSLKHYSSAMDMWSIGTIFGELLLRRPVFPGTDGHNQLELIFNLLGTPSQEEIDKIPHSRAREKILRMIKRPGRAFEAVFNGSNPEAVDLLQKMLMFDPDKRITVENALKHPYLLQFHLETDEPVAGPLSLYDFEFESQVLNVVQLKDEVYEELLLYHFPAKREEYEQAKMMYNEEFGLPPRKNSRDIQLSDDEIN